MKKGKKKTKKRCGKNLKQRKMTSLFQFNYGCLNIKLVLHGSMVMHLLCGNAASGVNNNICMTFRR